MQALGIYYELLESYRSTNTFSTIYQHHENRLQSRGDVWETVYCKRGLKLMLGVVS